MTYFKRTTNTSTSPTDVVNLVPEYTGGYSNYYGTMQDFTGTTSYIANLYKTIYQNNANTLNAIYEVYLVPDTTYKFVSNVGKSSNQAIAIFQVEDADDGTVYATHTEDLYSATLVWVNYSFTFTFSPAANISRTASRKCYIRLTNATKNASSSGYYLDPFRNFFSLCWTSTTNTMLNPANSRSVVKFEAYSTTFASGTDVVYIISSTLNYYWNTSQTRYYEVPLIVGKQYKFKADVYQGIDRGKIQTVVKDATGAITYNTLSVFDTYNAVHWSVALFSDTFTFQPTGYANDTVLTARFYIDNTLSPSGSGRYIIPTVGGFTVEQLT